MNSKRIASLLIIIILFMLMLPEITIAAENTGSWVDLIDDDDNETVYSFIDYSKSCGFRAYDTYNGNTSFYNFIPNYVPAGVYSDNSYKPFYRLLSSSKIGTNGRPFSRKTYVKNDSVNKPSFTERYIIYKANESKNESGEKNRRTSYLAAQNAWFKLKGNKIKLDDEAQDILDEAFEYNTWAKSVESELKATTGKTIDNATDEELNEALGDDFYFDASNSTISVVNDDDGKGDYILVSNIKTNGRDSFTHKSKKNDPDDCTFSLSPRITNIKITFYKNNNKNDTMSPIEGKYKKGATKCSSDGEVTGLFYEGGTDTGITLEFQEIEDHISKSQTRCQTTSTAICEISGKNHFILQEDSNDKGPGYYPFPFAKEKFNLKIPADFIKENNITGISEINIGVKTEKREVGLLKVKYDEIVLDDKNSSINNKNDGTGLKRSQLDDYTFISQITTNSALGLETETPNVITTNTLLAMPEKTLDEYEQIAKIDQPILLADASNTSSQTSETEVEEEEYKVKKYNSTSYRFLETVADPVGTNDIQVSKLKTEDGYKYYQFTKGDSIVYGKLEESSKTINFYTNNLRYGSSIDIGTCFGIGAGQMKLTGDSTSTTQTIQATEGVKAVTNASTNIQLRVTDLKLTANKNKTIITAELGGNDKYLEIFGNKVTWGSKTYTATVSGKKMTIEVNTEDILSSSDMRLEVEYGIIDGTLRNQGFRFTEYQKTGLKKYITLSVPNELANTLEKKFAATVNDDIETTMSKSVNGINYLVRTKGNQLAFLKPREIAEETELRTSEDGSGTSYIAQTGNVLFGLRFSDSSSGYYISSTDSITANKSLSVFETIKFENKGYNLKLSSQDLTQNPVLDIELRYTVKDSNDSSVSANIVQYIRIETTGKYTEVPTEESVLGKGTIAGNLQTLVDGSLTYKEVLEESLLLNTQLTSLFTGWANLINSSDYQEYTQENSVRTNTINSEEDGNPALKVFTTDGLLTGGIRPEVAGVEWDGNDLVVTMKSTTASISSIHLASYNYKEGWIQDNVSSGKAPTIYYQQSQLSVSNNRITIPNAKNLLDNIYTNFYILVRDTAGENAVLNIQAIRNDNGKTYVVEDNYYRILGTTHFADDKINFTNEKFYTEYNDGSKDKITFNIPFTFRNGSSDYCLDFYDDNKAKEATGSVIDNNVAKITFDKRLIQSLGEGRSLQINATVKDDHNNDVTVTIELKIMYKGQILTQGNNYKDVIGNYIVTVESPVYDLDISIDKSAFFVDKTRKDHSVEGSVNANTYHDFQLLVQNIPEGYTLDSVNSGAYGDLFGTPNYDIYDKDLVVTQYESKILDAVAGFTQKYFGDFQFEERVNKKVLEVQNGLPKYGLVQDNASVRHYILFKNASGDVITLTVKIEKIASVVVNRTLEKGVNVNNLYIEGPYDDNMSSLKDAVINAKNNNDSIQITETADTYNNKDMEVYFNTGENVNQKDAWTLQYELLNDYQDGGDISLNNESIQVIRVEQRGYLNQGYNHYANIELYFEDAISYEINYRYRINESGYGGDGYAGQMLSIVGDADENGIIYTSNLGNSANNEYIEGNKAIFRVNRNGFSCITVRFSDYSIQNIFVYAPTLFIGEVLNKAGENLIEDLPSIRDEGLLNRGAQFYVDLEKGDDKTLVFYNITGEVGLGDTLGVPAIKNGARTVAWYGESQTNDGLEWITTKDMWENYGANSTLIRKESNGSGKETYTVDLGDIEGFALDPDNIKEYSDESENNPNIIPSNYYYNVDTDTYELRWSFRSTDLHHDGKAINKFDTTLFTIIFRGNPSPTPGEDPELVYAKEIQEFRKNDEDTPDSRKVTPPEEGWDFTMEVGGEVWVDSPDTDKGVNTKYGLRDENDSRITQDMTVHLEEYEGTRLINTIDKTIKAGESSYIFEGILPPLASAGQDRHYYNIRFEYDGQKYEPTEFLSTSSVDIDNGIDSTNGNVNSIKQYRINDMINNLSKYKENTCSWVTESETTRKDFDSRLSTIDNKNGQVDYKNNPNYDEKISASTLDAGYTIPVGLEDYHLKNRDTSIQVKRTKIQPDTHYTIKGYSKSINLGLVERDESDIAVIQDLYYAKTVVKHYEQTYKYNAFKVNNQDINYTVKGQDYKLGLYSSDFIYNSGIYEDTAVDTFMSATELRLFLTYRINVINESPNVTTVVGQLADYYDDSFTLITDEVKPGIIEEGVANNTINNNKVVAYPSFYRKIDSGQNGVYNFDAVADGYGNNNSVTWTDTAEKGKKICNINQSMEPGEKIELFVTFEVDQETAQNAIRESMKTAYENLGDDATQDEYVKAVANEVRTKLMGEQHNYIELNNYSTKYRRRMNNTSAYSVDSNSGKIDRDSCPGNMVIGSLKEDDECQAPTLNVFVEGSHIREISGVVWDDSDKDKTDGQYIDGETSISNIPVSLIEKIKDPDNGIEYEFVHKGKYDGDTDTFNIKAGTNQGDSYTLSSEDGYKIKGMAPGIYSLRFEYGANDDMINNSKFTDINYKYNGQDYKNTKVSQNLDEEWMDVSENSSNRLSDAVDYIPARLRNIAYSRTISAENGSVLASKSQEKLQNTYMRADSYKMKLIPEIKETEEGTLEYTLPYDVKDVDFGLEKRPETKLYLDKKLTEITLTKSDGTEAIFNAKFDYEYDTENNKYKLTGMDIENGINLDKLTSVVEDGNQQGFRYIQMEDSYLSNLSINLKYDIYVTNISEEDYIRNTVADMKTPDALYRAASELEQSGSYQRGYLCDENNILGGYYFKHERFGWDDPVTTTVDQVVDYIDNDIGLDIEENTNVENHAWKFAEIYDGKTVKNSLAGLITNDSYNGEELTDNGSGNSGKGVSYFGTGKSNIALSVNSNIKTSQSGDEPEKETYYSHMKRTDAKVKDDKIYDEGQITLSATQARYKGNDTQDKYNPDLTKELKPNDTAKIGISTSKTISSGTDSDNLKFDNLAEILVYSNTVGRKDMDAIPGNANKIAKSSGAWAAGRSGGGERDSDSPEYITITPPTGLSEKMETSNNMLIVTIVATATAFIASITVPIITILYDKSRKTVKEDDQ